MNDMMPAYTSPGGSNTTVTRVMISTFICPSDAGGVGGWREYLLLANEGIVGSATPARRCRARPPASSPRGPFTT